MADAIERAHRRDRTGSPYRRLETENANLRTALLFALDDTPAQAVRALLTTRRLHWLWSVRGMGAETESYGYEERFLRREGELAPEDRWLVLLVKGHRLWRAGKPDEAAGLLGESERLAPGPATWRSVGPGLVLAHLHFDQGRREASYAPFERLADRAEAMGDLDEAGWLLADLASQLRDSGEWERWHPAAARAQALENRASGLPPDAPSPIWDSERARLEAREGRWADAERRMRAAAEGFARAGWRTWEVGILYELAHFVERQGRESEAIALYQKSLALSAELRDQGQLTLARQRIAALDEPLTVHRDR